MGWAAPWALFLALVPLVLLLHSLRLRRREVRISAVWEELLRERRSTFGMSKLLRSLLLLLQILGIAGLTLGLADPFARLPSTKEGDIVLVLDASASMRSMSKGVRSASPRLASLPWTWCSVYTRRVRWRSSMLIHALPQSAVHGRSDPA